MIKKKKESKECDEEAPYIFRRLRRAYYDELMSAQEYEQWYEKFLVAKVEKDSGFPPLTGTDFVKDKETDKARSSVGNAQNPRASPNP